MGEDLVSRLLLTPGQRRHAQQCKYRGFSVPSSMDRNWDLAGYLAAELTGVCTAILDLPPKACSRLTPGLSILLRTAAFLAAPLAARGWRSTRSTSHSTYMPRQQII